METIFLPTNVPVDFGAGPETTGAAADEAPVATGAEYALPVELFATGDGALGTVPLVCACAEVAAGASPDNDGHKLSDSHPARRRPLVIKTSAFRENVILKQPPCELRARQTPKQIWYAKTPGARDPW